MGQRKLRVALDGPGQMFRGAPQRSCRSEELSRRPAMNSLYASGSLLYRSRDLGTARGNRLCSDSTTRRPISSWTSNTSSSIEVMFLGQHDFLRRRIEQLHRDAPVRPQLLDRPLQGVANAQIAADLGRFGTAA